MRRTMSALGIALAVVSVGAGPALAKGTPQRPAGQVVPFVESTNGGDNGWGNCGHNSSGGLHHSDPNHTGNGGYKKGECGTVTSPAPVPAPAPVEEPAPAPAPVEEEPAPAPEDEFPTWDGDAVFV